MASPRSTRNASKKPPAKKPPAKKPPAKKPPARKPPVTARAMPRARAGLGPTTTLVKIIRRLDDVDEAWTIYMRRPWSATAECVVRPLTPRLTVPEEVKAAGYAYFLEIDVVHEVLEVFDQWPDKPPTEDEKVRVILYYGANDAWPPWVYER